MHCAQCNQPIHDLNQPCPHCGFAGDPAALAELAHVRWLLAELSKWPYSGDAERHYVSATIERYRARERALRVTLDLLFSPAELAKAWPDLRERETLERLLGVWRLQGLLVAAQVQPIAAELQTAINTLRQRLEGYPPSNYPADDHQRLEFVTAQLRMIDEFEQRGLFVSPQAYETARALTAAEIARLEIILGIRKVAPVVVAPAANEAVAAAQQDAAAQIASVATAAAAGAPVAFQPQPAAPVAPARPPAPPRAPALPFRDRFWQTLLSERTLQALLFLGIFLLIAAALSFVVIGWQTFPAWTRVAIPTVFTGGFFALGWYVRNRTALYRSGVALSAIAALLIPIDFYTVYANFDIPLSAAPAFWLVTSLLSLGAYIVITLIVRSRFFGFLVGAAAGSTVLSLVELAHQGFALSLDWRPASLALLSGAFIFIARAIDRRKGTTEVVTMGKPGVATTDVVTTHGADAATTEGVTTDKTVAAPTVVTTSVVTPAASKGDEPTNAAAPAVVTTSVVTPGASRAANFLRPRSRAELEGGRAFAFAEPLRNLALLAVAALMPLTFAWRYIDRRGLDDLHSALALTWFAGAFVFGWGAIHYRSRSLGVLAAITLPVATYLVQVSLFAQLHLSAAWHALGWALLVVLYFFISHRLRARADDPLLRGHGRTAGGWGVVLLTVAALWALPDSGSGALTHAVLACAVVLAARWWQRPRFLYAASLFAFSATTFGLSALGLPLAQLGIGWATLAIAHVLLALRLGRAGGVSQAFARPVVVAAYVIAFLSLLPALFPYNADLFIYSLGNWIVLAAWAARLAHVGQAGFATEDGGRQTADGSNERSAVSGQPSAVSGQPSAVRHPPSAIRRPPSAVVFQWLAAVPLPLWLWAVIANRGPLDAVLPLAFAALAWPLVLLSIRLGRSRAAYRLPWYLVGLATSLIAIETAILISPFEQALPITILSAGLLYFADALLSRQSVELLPAGLVTALGFSLLLERVPLDYDSVTFAVALLLGLYIIGGLAMVRRDVFGRSGESPYRSANGSRNFTQAFLSPLFASAHLVGVALLLRIYVHPIYTVFFRVPWSDEMLLWGAAVQLLLGVVYAAYAWGTFKRHWAFVAVWLATAGAGLLALFNSDASGSLSAQWALSAIVLIVAERALHDLRRRGNDLETRLSRHLTAWQRAVVRALWALFHEPLLVTGWFVSLMVIASALLRNLLLLNGRTPQTWSAIALLLIVVLYALSARLFKQARFLWFAAALVFAPWTILTALGFYVLTPPSAPGFAISWMALAWLLFLAGLGLAWRLRRDRAVGLGAEGVREGSPLPNLTTGDRAGSPLQADAYARPLKVVAHVLVPFALLWGMFDVDTSRVTILLCIGFYGLAAALDFAAALAHPTPLATRRERLRATRFFYPWLGLMPVWALYLLAWLVPTAQQELYGLLLVVCGPLGLAAGQWLERIALNSLSRERVRAGDGAALPFPPAFFAQRGRVGVGAARGYGLPAYLTCYVALICGTLLVAHIHALLALVLLCDAALFVASARVFRQPLWLYAAAVLTPVALGLALDASQMPFNRYGWWLLALAAVYCALGWTLRRLKLSAYSNPLLVAGFALIALALPPSSRDQDGALYGYAFAALLYALNAFWLRQPLLLTPASALVVVPYAILVQRSPLPAEQYGLALLPGAVLALACGALLDRAFGALKNFPWGDIDVHLTALSDRWFNWWALPLYVLGFALAAASPLFVKGHTNLLALDFLLLVPILGWGIYAFRLRAWLAAAALAGHLVWWFYLLSLGWDAMPVELAIRFVPLTAVTAALGLWVQRMRREESPLHLDPHHLWRGWSHVLFAFVAIDIFLAQSAALQGSWAGALVTLSHLLLLGALASVWRSRWLPYVSVLLGIVAFLQWLATLGGGDIVGLPVVLSYLALAYGVAGFGLRLARLRFFRPSGAPRAVSTAQALGALWEAPLQHVALVFSLGILLLTAWLGIDLIGWTVRALLGTPVRQLVRLPVAQMVVGVLSVLGLLYVTAALSYRRMRLGYAAIGVLLLAWSVHAFYVQQWDDTQRVQFYALPAGLYLLAIAWLEWQRGNRTLSRWLDYAAVVLMMGSLFWQTMLFGWLFALLLGAEGFAAFWWGSARRLRRFLYVGMLGVVLATLAQLLNALQSVNQWIVFGLIGLLVVLMAVAVERQLDKIKVWRETLETWE